MPRARSHLSHYFLLDSSIRCQCFFRDNVVPLTVTRVLFECPRHKVHSLVIMWTAVQLTIYFFGVTNNNEIAPSVP